MEVTLKSKYDVGDLVAHEDGETGREYVGPVIEVRHGDTWHGFTYQVQGPDGELWGWFREYEIRLPRSIRCPNSGITAR